jgi:hypothetical protein
LGKEFVRVKRFQSNKSVSFFGISVSFPKLLGIQENVFFRYVLGSKHATLMLLWQSSPYVQSFLISNFAGNGSKAATENLLLLLPESLLISQGTYFTVINCLSAFKKLLLMELSIPLQEMEREQLFLRH